MTIQPRVVEVEQLLLNVDQAAKVLDTSRSRVYELIKSGEIIAVKHGRLTKITAKSLHDYVDRLIAESGPPPAA